MGLGIEVGLLAQLLEDDPEGAEWLRESFVAVNEVLVENGLGPHDEPEELPPLDNRAAILSYPYSFLHHLRRVAAHALEKPGWVATQFPKTSDPTADPLVAKHSNRLTSHLLCHSDCEGFYLPIKFANVIDDVQERVPGRWLGSSFMLREELNALAPVLGIRLHRGTLSDEEAENINREAEEEGPLFIEKAVWISHYEAARLSIQHATAICYC